MYQAKAIQKTRKNAIVECLDYQIPDTQLKGAKKDGDISKEISSEIISRHLPAISIYG